MGKYTLDRIEGKYAILLNRKDEEKQIDVPLKKLPFHVKEGDILDVKFTQDNSIENVTILKDETFKAKKQVQDLIQKLINKNDK